MQISELEESIIQKARDFSIEVVKQTYDRFSYDFNRRVETIFIGKIAEEVFIKFSEDWLETKLSSNYDIYIGTENVDEFDFEIHNKQIDIKSSKDTKNEGVENCYRYFNFPVPVDQRIKDITISILYDYHINTFHIVSWIDKSTYTSKCQVRKLPVGKGIMREFYLYPLRNGRKISELKKYLLTS